MLYKRSWSPGFDSLTGMAKAKVLLSVKAYQKYWCFNAYSMTVIICNYVPCIHVDSLVI